METFFIGVGFETLNILLDVWKTRISQPVSKVCIYLHIDNNGFEEKQYSWKSKNCVK